MKHLLPFVFLLVSFSTALADTPAKITEDYRKAAAAALTKLNETLEQATTPLIAKFISSGDTDGVEKLTTQLKAKLEGEPVPTPHASVTLLFAQYDQARAKALESVQKASISRIDSLLKSLGKPTLETVTELGKLRAEFEVEKVAATTDSRDIIPENWTYHMAATRPASGSLTFKRNGTLVLQIYDRPVPEIGSWKKTNAPGQFSLAIHSGQPFLINLTGDTVQLDIPEVGKRFMKPATQEPTKPAAEVDVTAMTPKSPAGTATPKQVAELVKARGGNCINGSGGEEIAFSNTALSAPDLLLMGAAKRLKSFSWNGGSGLTDVGMAAFEGKKNLSNLFLWAVGSLSDEGLKSLTGCDKLETLNIGSNGGGITGSGFESLGQCKALRQLTLNSLTGIEGRNLRFLSQMKSLEVLSLSACKGVTDEDMEWIAPMTHLKKLRLGGTRVTDAGLAKLTGLRHLEELIVTAPQVTPAGVEMLKKSSPGLVVIFAK